MNHAIYRLLNNRLTLPFRPFYRTHPYKNGISINSADARGCVDTELGFFYSRIPKAANSTVVSNLVKYKFGRSFPPKQEKKLFRHPSQLTSAEVDRLSQLFRFTVVRNPYTRTLSAYLDKVERLREMGKRMPKSFGDFLQGLADNKLYKNAHWAPQHSLLLLPLEQLDFVGKVESLERDMADIRARLLPQDEQQTHFSSTLGNATGASKKLLHYYDDQNIELVQQMFRKDFELFDYPLTLPT